MDARKQERCNCREEKADWLCIDPISLLLLTTISVLVFDRFHRLFLSLASKSVYSSGTLLMCFLLAQAPLGEWRCYPSELSVREDS
jgi:hypothetical protein